LKVADRISGKFNSAILRWRLAPGNWSIDGDSVTNGSERLSISSQADIVRFALVEGEESLFYLARSPVSVLEVEVRAPGLITSEYGWS